MQNIARPVTMRDRKDDANFSGHFSIEDSLAGLDMVRLPRN